MITETEIDSGGKPTTESIIDEPGVDPEFLGDSEPGIIAESEVAESQKFYVDEGQVEIAAHFVYELDPDGKQSRVVRYTDYAGEKVRTLFPSAPELQTEWADPIKRDEIIERLSERGIDFDELAAAANQPDADPFDPLCHLAYNAPLRTRRERATRLWTEKKDFFDRYGPEAREILNELLEKYAEHRTAQFLLPVRFQIKCD